jgi:hypothetical protein
MGSAGWGECLGAALLLALGAGEATPQAAPSPAAGTGRIATATVHGKLDMVNERLNGVSVITDDGARMAWQLDKRVIAHVKRFKPGDPVVVIYRVRGGGTAVTAIAFPGAAKTPTYVNTSAERVELVSGPMVDGACGKLPEAPIHTTTIPVGGRAGTEDACWCCAPAGGACVPANKTGLGQAFLVQCYE